MEIIKLLNSYDDLMFLGGVGAEKIKDAEIELKISFSEEFKMYLTEFGVASFGGREITGITESDRLNVVSVTKKYRNLYPVSFEKYYVIEEMNIDSIVIWQDEKGYIYQSVGKNKLNKIFNSFSDYLMSFEE